MSHATPLPEAAQEGFANASHYDKHRPSYPPEAVEQLLSSLKLSGQNGATVVDLAAGTGKFTVPLAQREEAFNIVAVEPHDRMRGELERKNLPNVKTIKGTAAKIPLESQSAHGVIAAQAFHWFATRESIEEIHRVLRPGGSFGMIWNIEDYNAPQDWKMYTPWEEKVHKLIWAFDDGHTRYRHQKWRTVFDDQVKSSPFTIQSADPLFSLPLGEEKLPFTRWLTKVAIWDRIRTLSQIAILEGEELERVKKVVFDALESEGVETNEQGEISLHGNTVFSWTSAIPSDPVQSGG